jgi:large subunit ribosomal protein L32e
MAEDEDRKEDAKVAKKAKKTAVPEVSPEPKAALPTATEIRAARKAELIAWAGEFGLSTEGKVDDLRKRVLDHVHREAEKAAPKEEAKPEKPEKPAPKAEKKPKKKEAKPRKKAKEAEEEEEKEEAEIHEPRAKPKLEPGLRKLLALRAAKNAQRPKFHRQEWFRYRMFGDEWRKPQGGQSKLRRHFGYRWNLPSIGYRGPRGARGLHPSGFREVLVHNEGQLEGLDASTQAVRIAHGVGTRKRELIEKACDDKGLRVLNRMVTE